MNSVVFFLQVHCLSDLLPMGGGHEEESMQEQGMIGLDESCNPSSGLLWSILSNLPPAFPRAALQ